MNFQRLFATQKTLDDRIVKEKELDGQDLLDEKILALQVELGELANEWRGFKFWSEVREPKEIIYTNSFIKNPILEEYVDCMHLILSIGNDLKCNSDNYNLLSNLRELDTVTLFSELISRGGSFNSGSAFINTQFELYMCEFLVLGEKLDLTWKQIEQAYYYKNKINHERQDNGY